MKKLLTVVLVTTFALTGCMGNTNDTQKNPTENTRYEQARYNDHNINDNEEFTEMRNRDNNVDRRDETEGTRNTNNQEYDVSKEAADRITKEVSDINQAYVLTTKNNAYVAAVLDDKKDGQRDRANNTNNRNDTAGDMTQDKSNNSRTKTDRNNDDGDDLTDDVKKKITDIVQSVDKNIDNVYVTTSPDFINLSNEYINDVNDGRSVKGFFDQIGNAIERVFPQQKSNK